MAAWKIGHVKLKKGKEDTPAVRYEKGVREQEHSISKPKLATSSNPDWVALQHKDHLGELKTNPQRKMKAISLRILNTNKGIQQ